VSENHSELLFEQEGQIATITFNRPQARNAMTWGMYEGLVAACEQINASEDIRVAVLRGAGDKAFVAGTDIKQFLEFQTAEDGLVYERRIEAVLDKLEQVRVPTIAVIDGYAVGGGLGIAASCDLRICTPAAKFGLPVARTLGNCLSMRTYARLVDLVGSARALHLIYTASFIPADEALAVGLATEVVTADLDARVRELCEELRGRAPLTMWASKQAVRRLRDSRLPNGEDLVAACYGSDDFHEGVRAFVEKRPPQWRGK
jgi:enoyl-CoA hydratase/carnithine racemase